MILDSQYPALLLNADWQPVHMHPLSTITWQDAVKSVFLDRVTVVEEYDMHIHSETQTWRLPSVVALKQYMRRDQLPTFSRYNVYLRDEFTCQYCGQDFEPKLLTFDHVVPRALGGKNTWANVVAACSPCNHRKGSKLTQEAKMFPINAPWEPSTWDLYGKERKIPNKRANMHTTWRDYLYDEISSDG